MLVAKVIFCQDRDYRRVVALKLISFFRKNFSAKAHAGCDDHTSQCLLIKFKNTSVLYSNSGYDWVDGDFEVVTAGEMRFLVSPFPFLYVSNLQPIQSEPFFLDRTEQPLRLIDDNSPRVSVIVPVYGSPRYTHDVRSEIEAFLPELRGLKGRVILSIDGHDAPGQTSLHLDVLKGIDAEMVEVHSHPKNIGFIRNVNSLYSKTAPNEIVVLLTTDVKMQPSTLSRVIAPLIKNEKIALSTPFAIGGENLEAPESDALHWHDIDAIISGIEPTYPDAETNVGYLLAVDRRKYKGSELFDEFFTNGYGDDSDLYFRCVSLGLRGVVVDNCCVYHEHGASFNLTRQRSKLRLENHRRFMERWGAAFRERHAAASANLEKIKAEKSEIVSSLLRALPMPQIVFLLPKNDRRIGGVAAVFNLVEALCDKGVPAAVISTGARFSEFGFQSRSIPFDHTALRDMVLANASFLVATAHDTCDIVKELAKQHRLRTAYFVQGPEFSFSDGNALRSVVTGYRGFDSIFVVSSYLAEVIKDFVTEPVNLIPYGPNPLDYYDLSGPREHNSIAVQLNGNPQKGAAYVAGVIASLAHHGYKVYSFGDDSLRGKRQNFCNHLGFLSTSEKVQLFNSVEFYLDASNYEGLGLLLMESIQCGALPVYRHNGGTAEILKAAGIGIEVGDYAAIGKIKDQISDFRKERDFETERGRCKAAIENHSIKSATEALLRWWNAQR